jgi:flavin-binding protein dodecin
VSTAKEISNIAPSTGATTQSSALLYRRYNPRDAGFAMMVHARAARATRPAAGGSLRPHRRKGDRMADSVYRVTEVIGTSSESWEAAARSAVETAAKTVRDLRIAEVIRQDVTIENGAVTGFRVRLGISFKYESGE